MAVYKIWIEIEKADDANDFFEGVGEPVCLATLPRLADAKKIVKKLLDQVNPEETARCIALRLFPFDR
jgi:hypothetical protein